VTVYSERGLPERTSFRAPGIRSVSPTIRSEIGELAPVARGVGDGVVISARADQHTVTLRSIDSYKLISEVLRNAGFEVGTSDAGKWTARLVELFGGAASTLASQPSMREVLDLAARPRGGNAQELRSIAAKHSGKWSEEFGPWRTSKEYVSWVLGVLAARRIVEPILNYACPECGLPQSLGADRVGALLSCEDCEAQTPLALQILLGATWRLRTRTLLTQQRLRSVLSVAAALHTLICAARDQETVHYALGLDLVRDGKPFEIDFAVFITDGNGSSLVIGEAKARQDIETADIDNLEAVQEAVRATGVECFLAVASAKERLNESEVARLRDSAGRFLFGLHPSRGRGGDLNLPVVLTKGSLTTPALDENHPARRPTSGERSLEILGRSTCERELGLDGFGDLQTRTLHWREPAEGTAPPTESDGPEG
jgi:hypothetical protein